MGIDKLTGMSKKVVGIVAACVVVLMIAAATTAWQYRFDVQRGMQRAQLPEAKEYEAVVEKSPALTVAAAIPVPTAAILDNLPAEANLAVPFIGQAPHGNWEPPYKEFCEEASIVMAMRYVRGQKGLSPDEASAEMRRIQAFEEQTFGEYQDTNVEQTAAVLSDFYKYPDISILENPTADQIRRAIADGKPVIVPAAGRLLGNPFFQQPGPLYHMFVVKGYTADGRFIVNDPGTRRGADFIYSETVVMNAMHDWREDENITAGRKAVIVVGS